jgi:dephospho-CoA kinase
MLLVASCRDRLGVFGAARNESMSTARPSSRKMESMKTIGLVGGVASGKSAAGRMLVDLGAGLLDADRTGHAVLESDEQIRSAIRNRWGDEMLTSDGSIDRAAVAKRVFAQDEAGAADRKFLEALVHPRIHRLLSEARAQFAAERKHAVVLDAPLLLEAGWRPLCDIVLLVDASREKRLERAKTRGWTETEFDRREAAQMPLDEKRRLATAVLSNNGSENDLRAAVRNFWTENIGPIPDFSRDVEI